MNEQAERYSYLSPLRVEEKIRTSILACNFFSLKANAEMCDFSGKAKKQGHI